MGPQGSITWLPQRGINTKDLNMGTRRGPLLAQPPGDKKLGGVKKGHRSSVILKSKK